MTVEPAPEQAISDADDKIPETRNGLLDDPR